MACGKFYAQFTITVHSPVLVCRPAGTGPGSAGEKVSRYSIASAWVGMRPLGGAPRSPGDQPRVAAIHHVPRLVLEGGRWRQDC